MNIKPWITTISGVVVASLAFAASPAFAEHNNYVTRKPVYDYARVISAEPIVRYVTVTNPVKECWSDVEYYTVDHRPRRAAGSTLFGAIVGGVVGHQFGGGRGKAVATALGSVIGAGIGSDAANRAPYQTTQYSRPVTRCETTRQTHEEERVDGYNVIYAYNGRKYATRTPHDPGSRLRIRVDVRPAG